jgi:tetratricopeptide (TPR) repeat protein
MNRKNRNANRQRVGVHGEMTIVQSMIRFVCDLFQLTTVLQRLLELETLWNSAKQLAAQDDWTAAIQAAELILEQPSFHSPLKQWVWNRRMKPLRQEIQQHLVQWNHSADTAYDKILGRSRWLAHTGQFQAAIEILEPLHQQFFRLEGKQHLDALAKVIEERQSLYLALLAEREGEWETAIDQYKRLCTLMPKISTELNFRLTVLAIKIERWEDAIQFIKSIAKSNPDSRRATELLAHIQTQKALEKAAVKTSVKPKPSVPIVTPIANPIEELHRLKRSAIVASKDQHWQHCTQTLEKIWWIEGDYDALYRWSLAAYYQAIAQPDRASLETHLMTRAMALTNLSGNVKLSPAEQLELRTRLRQQSLELIQSNSDPTLSQRLIQWTAIDELAMNELIAAPHFALCRKRILITPMMYRRYPNLATELPPLPESFLGALYTNWATTLLLCQQDKFIEAKQLAPRNSNNSKPHLTHADRYAKRHFAYYEACHYLKLQPGGYPRWREAKQPLQEAKSEICDRSLWQEKLDQLFEAHYGVLWEANDRLELTELWVNILDSSTAHRFFNRCHDT